MLELLGDTSDEAYPIFRGDGTEDSSTVVTIATALVDLPAWRLTVYRGNPRSLRVAAEVRMLAWLAGIRVHKHASRLQCVHAAYMRLGASQCSNPRRMRVAAKVRQLPGKRSHALQHFAPRILPQACQPGASPRTAAAHGACG